MYLFLPVHFVVLSYIEKDVSPFCGATFPLTWYYICCLPRNWEELFFLINLLKEAFSEHKESLITQQQHLHHTQAKEKKSCLQKLNIYLISR